MNRSPPESQDHRRDQAVHPQFRPGSRDDDDCARALRPDVGALSGSGQSGHALGVSARSCLGRHDDTPREMEGQEKIDRKK
jgi:hypothetical protein